MRGFASDRVTLAVDYWGIHRRVRESAGQTLLKVVEIFGRAESVELTAWTELLKDFEGIDVGKPRALSARKCKGKTKEATCVPKAD